MRGGGSVRGSLAYSPAAGDSARAPLPGERMYHEAMLKQQRGLDADVVPVGPALECTFAPAINQRSRRMMEDAELPSSFLERQRCACGERS